MTEIMTRRDVVRSALALLAGAATLDPLAPGSAGRGATSAAAPTGRPRPTKGLYLSYYGVRDHGVRSRVLDLLERTELNAVVIDVKGDRGFIAYESRVPLARSAGAMEPGRPPDFDRLLAGLKAQGVHTIGRIVAFKDGVLARHRPDWAVADSSGGLWRDNEGLAWLDPFREEAWAYLIAIAEEAAAKGFAEIQFDYLRFPSDGRPGATRYAKPSTQPSRLETIARFLARARAALAAAGGAVLAIDVFGYTAFNPDDTGIGQRIEEMAPLVDVLCPMAYPSAYHRGIPGYRDPVAHPYEIVLETVKRARERATPAPGHGGPEIRPWIQDFRDYAFDRRSFGVAEVRAQMKGALDAGADGWMLWNPGNHYTVEALEPR